MRVFLAAYFLLALLASAYAEPFKVTVPGKPSMMLTLDREYTCIAMNAPDGKQMQSCILTPTDDQSGVVLQIGRAAEVYNETSLKAKEPGATFVQQAGQINGKKVSWLRYKQPQHLCSATSVTLKDKAGKSTLVSIWIVANSDERRDALEKAFSSIKLR